MALQSLYLTFSYSLNLKFVELASAHTQLSTRSWGHSEAKRIIVSAETQLLKRKAKEVGELSIRFVKLLEKRRVYLVTGKEGTLNLFLNNLAKQGIQHNSTNYTHKYWLEVEVSVTENVGQAISQVLLDNSKPVMVEAVVDFRHIGGTKFLALVVANTQQVYHKFVAESGGKVGYAKFFAWQESLERKFEETQIPL